MYVIVPNYTVKHCFVCCCEIYFVAVCCMAFPWDMWINITPHKAPMTDENDSIESQLSAMTLLAHLQKHEWFKAATPLKTPPKHEWQLQKAASLEPPDLQTAPPKGLLPVSAYFLGKPWVFFLSGPLDNMCVMLASWIKSLFFFFSKFIWL